MRFSAGRLAAVGHPDERHTRRTLRSTSSTTQFYRFSQSSILIIPPMTSRLNIHQIEALSRWRNGLHMSRAATRLNLTQPGNYPAYKELLRPHSGE